MFGTISPMHQANQSGTKMPKKMIKTWLKEKGLVVGGNKSDLIYRYLNPTAKDFRTTAYAGRDMQRPPTKKKKTKSLREQYHPVLVRFMNWKDKPAVPYDKETIFSNETLFTITPRHLARWFNLKVFGKEEPGKNIVSFALYSFFMITSILTLSLSLFVIMSQTTTISRALVVLLRLSTGKRQYHTSIQRSCISGVREIKMATLQCLRK